MQRGLKLIELMMVMNSSVKSKIRQNLIFGIRYNFEIKREN